MIPLIMKLVLAAYIRACIQASRQIYGVYRRCGHRRARAMGAVCQVDILLLWFYFGPELPRRGTLHYKSRVYDEKMQGSSEDTSVMILRE